MVYKRKRQFLEFIFLLGLIGLALSSYLTYLHYFPVEEAFCDITEQVACSPFNKSNYSTIFNIPIALFGMVWFGVLLSLNWVTLKKNKDITKEILGWSVVGTFSVVYFVGLEIALKTICPLCTIIHAAVITILVLSFLLYKNRNLSGTA